MGYTCPTITHRATRSWSSPRVSVQLARGVTRRPQPQPHPQSDHTSLAPRIAGRTSCNPIWPPLRGSQRRSSLSRRGPSDHRLDINIQCSGLRSKYNAEHHSIDASAASNTAPRSPGPVHSASLVHSGPPVRCPNSCWQSSASLPVGRTASIPARSFFIPQGQAGICICDRAPTTSRASRTRVFRTQRPDDASPAPYVLGDRDHRTMHTPTRMVFRVDSASPLHVCNPGTQSYVYPIGPGPHGDLSLDY